MDENNDMYRDILERITSGVYFVDRERVITYWNYGAERLSGFPASEVVGKRCSEFLKHVDEKGEPLCGAACPLLGVIQDGLPRQAEVNMHHKMGQLIPVLVQGVALTDAQGGIKGAVEIFQDISPLKLAQARIRELADEALFDKLTGVYNRRGLELVVETRLSDFKTLGAPFAVIFIDLDRFKPINDRYGHPVGDQVLAGICSLLKRSLRETDAIGRWGGDEFILVLKDVTKLSLAPVMEKIQKMISEGIYETDAGPLSVDCSLGGSVPGKNDDVKSIVRRADRKMYSSKRSKR